jgi:hypothetical protein
VTDHVDNILSGLLKRHACKSLRITPWIRGGMDKVHLSYMELKWPLLQFTHVRSLFAISRNELHILDHNELDMITN